MAIAIDASSPAAVNAQTNTATTIATASFTPPANSLVIASASIIYASASGTGSPFSISDSLSGTWNSEALQVWGSSGNPAAGIWARFVASSAAMTVTLTTDANSKTKQLMVKVLTGTATSAWSGNKINNQASTAGFLQQNFTTSVAGSWVFLAIGNNGTATLTVNANTTSDAALTSTADGGTVAQGHMTTATVSPGTVSLGWTGDPAVAHVYTAAEIKPPPVFWPKPIATNRGARAALTRSYSY